MDSTTRPARIMATLAAMACLAVTAVVSAPVASAATTVTQTFGYTGSTATFTVPAGVTQLTITALGAQGGRGGADASGLPPAGGYQGAVSGTMAVTPGQVLTIAVGKGGANGASGSHGSNVPASYFVGAAVGGANPLGGYGGGNGGVAGANGSSGFGGSGGAATVIQTLGATIVAGGSGGSGGSGQYSPTLGRLPYATFSGRTDTTSTAGQVGVSVEPICTTIPGNNCDGGGGGGAGGGAQGGAGGSVEFGSGTSTEWFGYGGYPGQNDTAGIGGLSATYQYFSTNDANGSVTIAYTAGAPDAPTGVAGVAADSSVSLTWTAPQNVGASAVSDYVVEYADTSNPSSWTTFNDGASTATSATVTGLTNGVSYLFRVSAVNTTGTSAPSSTSSPVAPYGVPTAPSITGVSPLDGGLSVSFTPASSGGPILDYEYQLNGSGPWMSSGTTTSPLSAKGLVNGTSYSVAIRAVNSVGTGPASWASSGVPAAPAGAPNVTAVSTGIGSATVSFTPGYAGGSPITGYDYQLNGGAWVSAGSTTSPLTIAGLANGTAYAISIRAVTAAGAGAASGATTVTTPDVPAAPTVTSLVAGDGTLSVVFSSGNSDGSAVTAVQYQLTAGGPWSTAPSTSSPIAVSGLTNGTTYAVTVREVNAVGVGVASAPQSATPATVPGAPSIIGNTVAGSNAQLSADFTAPASDGGSVITTYEYSTDGGATWLPRAAGTTGSPLVITTLSSDGTTPLVNGTTYQVELRAVNSVGAGPASAVAPGMAQTTPAAPTMTSVVPGPASLTVTFAPGSNGGAAVTAYQYRLGSGTWTDTATLGTSFLVGGLTNGTAYAVSVRAVNSQGASAASAAVSGTPRTVPGQPTVTGVSRADRTLVVAVSPGGDGGSAVADLQYSTDGGLTWRSAGTATSPLTITALSSDGVTRIANGSTYPVSVRAVNAAGAGAASAVTTVGPGTVPAAPAVVLTPLDGAIQVGFVAGSDGGSPVSAVDYRIDGGAWVDAGTISSPFVVSGLANGTTYAVEVRLDNALGTGAASAPATTAPRSVPDAPTGVTAVSDTASADVAWTAPAVDGGSPVTSYIATAYNAPSSGAAVNSCTTAGTACSITGLTNGTTYYVSVVAVNAAGSSQPSAPALSVTPLARPGAPTLTSLTAGNTSISASFMAGVAGSSAITGYQYQLNGGSWRNASGTSSPLVLSGLTNGTAYSAAIRAVNAAGPGPSSGTLTATPYTFPDAPSATTIVANGVNGAAVVSWVAPNDNGSPITSYTATAFTAAVAGSQAATCTTASLTCTIAGLANGTTYYVSLQALNAAGYSVRSTPRVAVTPSLLPGAVSAVTGVAGDGRVSLTWTAGSTGASAVTDYTVWYSSGAGWTQFADGISTATTATVTGLTNGTAYTFEVYAVNGSGTGPASAPSSPVTPLAPGTVPTLSVPAAVVDGFDVAITNHASGTTYGVTTSAGTVTTSGSTISVRGLGSGGSATVTVTASVAGFTTTTTTTSGTSLVDGVPPTFTSLTKTVDGFTADIANYVPSGLYTVTAANGATVSRYGSSLAVSGLAPGAASDLTVGVSRAGYSDASAVVSGSALATGWAPQFVSASRTADGFTVDITNYSPTLVYTATATNGGTVTLIGSTVVVSRLPAGGTSVVTVTVVDPGVSWAGGAATGSALQAGSAPTLSAPVPSGDGWTSTITDFSPDVTYSATATDGAAVALNGAAVVVTGLSAGASSTVSVTASRAGYTGRTASVTGSALLAGTPAHFAPPVATSHGFTVEITNVDPSATYEVTASGGALVTRAGSLITVSGLAPAGSSTVTVTVVQGGHVDATSSVTAAAAPQATPTGTPSPAPTSTPAAHPSSSTPAAHPTATSAGAGAPSSGAAPSVTPDGSTTSQAPSTPSFVAEQQPGSGSAYVDGRHVGSVVHRTDTGVSVSASASGLTMAVVGLAADTPVRPSADGVITVSPEGTVRVSVKGFSPGTTATVWGFSTPTRLTGLPIAADRSGSQEFDLPSSMRPGRHTIVVDGTSAAGRPVALAVGILVADAAPSSGTLRQAGVASSTGAVGRWWIVGVLVTLLAGLLLLAVRRRRDQPETAPGITGE